ncbi:uncharacterized protein [Amphiura filiformis]|uniref:uncharacterized protein n=1 Tax=Amphiura filiformis TaxID=82378 RepID=UPI003B221D8A
MGNMDEEEERTKSQIAASDPNNETEEQPSHNEDDIKHEHKKHKKKKKKHKHKDKDRDEHDLESASNTGPSEINHANENLEQTMNEEESTSNGTLPNHNLPNHSSSLDDVKEKSDDDVISSGEDSKILEQDKKKLLKRRQSYKEEKHALKKKLEDTRNKFEEEINKYEKDLDAKRQEYLSRMSELKLDEQYASLTQQMEDVSGLEQAVDRRLQQCTEQQQEVEDLERFLDRRQQLCNSREADLRRLDEELDTLHQELELDRDRLARAGFDTSNIGNRKDRKPSLNTSSTSQWKGDDDDDYIVKANLRKCQANLKKTEETLTTTNEQLATLKEQVQTLQTEKKKNLDKIKHLETQLSVALSQLSQKTMQSKVSSADRYKSSRTHVNQDRLSSANLSINQQAQLRRSQRGSIAPSTSSSKYALMSVPNSPNSTMGKSDGSSHSPLSSEGSPSTSTAFLHDGNGSRFDGGTRSRTESTTSSQRNVSATCCVM